MLPAGHSLNRLAAIPLTALAGERFFLYARGANVTQYDSFVEACRNAGFEPSLGPELPHLFATFPAVAAGSGSQSYRAA
jgi:hypothetical protein